VSRLRLALSVLGAGLLAAGIYAAVLEGLADAHYYNVRIPLTEADRAKRAPDAATLAGAQASLALALALDPTNPLYVEQRARLHEMEALRLPRGSAQARVLLHQALVDFRTAALMRPGSPYAWAAIASLKLRLDNLDFEFYGALDRAARYGRWEPAVQLALADIGLAGWRLLAQPAKQLALDAIARAWPRQERELRRLAVAHGTLPLVCDEVPRLRPQGIALCVRN
jgi:hypothetical protein